jgi:sugar phosphate isomerase/epimerase
MRLGIGSYAFAWAAGVPGNPPRQPIGPFDLLESACCLGVRVAQFCDNLPLSKLTPDELNRFEDRARSAGVIIELGTRGLDPKNLRFHLNLCRRFNAPFLRLVIDSHGDEPTPAEAVDRLRPIAREFSAAGVRIAIENHDRFTSAALAWIVTQLGPENAGICLDTVNSLGALEGPQVVVETLGEWTLCLHVKDFTIRRMEHNMGFLVEGCPAGQGRLDLPWLLKALEHCPNRFNAILETWVTPGDSLDETIARERSSTEQGVRYLRGLIPD